MRKKTRKGSSKSCFMFHVSCFMLLTSCFLLPAPSAFAEKTNIANTYPTLGRGVRPLGMGNAFLTMQGTDENALFYNPASIRDLPNDLTWSTTMIPVTGPAMAYFSLSTAFASDKGEKAKDLRYAILFTPSEYNYETIGLVKKIFDFKDDLDAAASDSEKIDVFETFVDKHMGKFYSADPRFPLISVYNRYFAASLITDARLGVSFRNRAFPNFEIKSRNFVGLAFGSAYGFLEDSLEVGASTKILYGVENEQIITTSDILTKKMDDFKWKEWKRGMGVGFDLGAKYHIPDFGVNIMDVLQPTVAVTYQDIGNTRFIAMKKNGGPEKLPQTVSAGVGVHPTFGTIDTSFEVDFRELNVKEDLLLKLNVGAEARFPRMAGIKPSLRGGMQQSYPTVGCGLEIWKVTWNFAFFGKEVGQTTRQKAGYRLASEIVWRF